MTAINPNHDDQVQREGGREEQDHSEQNKQNKQSAAAQQA
jgi:hypothetical protein